MIHDKFCPSTQDDLPLWQPPCTVCEMLTQVRADEREQAAQRVAALSPAEYIGSGFVLSANDAIAAARGGEHEHSWERRYGEKTHHCECGAYLKDENYGGERA